MKKILIFNLLILTIFQLQFINGNEHFRLYVNNNLITSKDYKLYSEEIKNFNTALSGSVNEVLQETEPHWIEASSSVDIWAVVKIIDIWNKAVIEKVKSVQDVDLVMDHSVKDYLIVNGFHPDLGIQPLKQLMEQVVINQLSIAFIMQDIPHRSKAILSYAPHFNNWYLNWEKVKAPSIPIFKAYQKTYGFTMEDGSKWSVCCNKDVQVIKTWKSGDRLKITYDAFIVEGYCDIKIENLDTPGYVGAYKD